MAKKPKVYLSAPYHYYNKCAISGCDENTHNNEYLDELVAYLDACGIAWKRGYRRAPNDGSLNGDELMKKAVAESNAWGADVHYISHTNAFNGTVRGYRPMIYTGSKGGEKLAKIMVAKRKEIYDQPISLTRRTDLYELNAPVAVSYYEEHVFHDNKADAKWFHENLRAIAANAAQGLCEYFGIPFVDPYAEKKLVVLGEYGSLREADDALGEIHTTISSLETALDEAKTYVGKLDAALKNVKVVG